MSSRFTTAQVLGALQHGRREHLAHPSLDAPQFTQNDLPGLGFWRLADPRRLGFSRIESKRSARSTDHVVVVERLPVVSVKRRSGAPDQDGARVGACNRAAFSKTSSSDGSIIAGYQIR